MRRKRQMDEHQAIRLEPAQPRRRGHSEVLSPATSVHGQDDEGGGDDVADPPWAQRDAA